MVRAKARPCRRKTIGLISFCIYSIYHKMHFEAIIFCAELLDCKGKGPSPRSIATTLAFQRLDQDQFPRVASMVFIRLSVAGTENRRVRQKLYVPMSGAGSPAV